MSFILTISSTLSVIGTIILGSIVHATGASLACPDWPLCFGTLTPAMQGAVLYEHSHRIIAGISGVLVWMTGFLYYIDARRSTFQRRLISGTMLLIAIQAILGGLTVLYKLPDWISTLHFVTANFTLACLVVLTWGITRDATAEIGLDVPSHLRWFSGITGVLVFSQMCLGAWLRHIGSTGGPMSFTCKVFPLCEPKWLEYITADYSFYYWTHRITAILVAIGVCLTTFALFRFRSKLARSYTLGLVSSVLVLVQILLGALSVRTYLAVTPVTLHLTGAVLLLLAMIILNLELFKPYTLRVANHEA